MKTYDGPLGKFQYDEDMYALKDGVLAYIGDIHYGCIECSIPEGVLYCDKMFVGNTNLQVGPILPKSCISANEMFADCINLVVYPDINLALMESNEFNSDTMFAGCTGLQKLCISDQNTLLDIYTCACEHSIDYKEHQKHASNIIQTENDRRVENYQVQHWLSCAAEQKVGMDPIAKVKTIKLSGIHHVIFDNIPVLVDILEERKKGHYIGLQTNNQIENAVEQASITLDTRKANVEETDMHEPSTAEPQYINIDDV